MGVPSCAHYDLSLVIQLERMHPAHKLYGGTVDVDCVVTVENRTPHQVDTIPFLLYRLLRVEGVGHVSAQELPFTQEVVVLRERPRQQANAVTVVLPTSLPVGETARVRLQYAGPVCGYPEVWPYVQDHVSESYTLLRRDVLWFPVVGPPTEDRWADSFTFDLSITVPSGDLIAVANGQTCAKTAGADSVSYQWRSSRPDRRLTVACAPFRRETIAPNVSLYSLPGDDVGAQIVARAMNRARELCIAWFGELPPRSLNVVEIPAGYGSEVSDVLILQAGGIFQAEDPDDPNVYQRALIEAGHEMIHLWGVPSREEDVTRFLDEGITHYIETLLLREELGEGAYWQRLDFFRSYFLSEGEAATSVPLAEAGLHMKVRDTIARCKGPWVLCVLHRLIGDALLPALRAFFDRYRTAGATLHDFQAAMADRAEVDLSRFFREWLWEATSSELLAQERAVPELIDVLAERYA